MQDNIFASQKRRGKYLFLPQMDTRQWKPVCLCDIDTTAF